MSLKTIGRICGVIAVLMLAAAFISALIACWSTGDFQDNLAAQAWVCIFGTIIFGCASGCCGDLDRLG